MSTERHASDCAVNNAPAYAPGPCDCALEECRYCGEDAAGRDALGRPACERHIQEVADDIEDYACGSAFCDDPACFVHNPQHPGFDV